MYLISKFFIVVPLLVGVAFITLFERKILGFSQLRKGPNKVSSGGILQPFADVIKLFSKEILFVKKSNKLIFFLAPIFALLVTVLLLSQLPLQTNPGFGNLGVLFVVILSLGIYPLFLAGWGSNSKYAFLGSIRGIAQTISYEISLAIILFSFYLFSDKFNLNLLSSSGVVNLMLLAPLMILLLLVAVAETNRTPFDFSEGESELVSGFNTEYSGGLFALIFMSEYGMIIFFSGLISLLSNNYLFVSVGSSLSLMFFWVWLRVTHPRYRYDKLLATAWKSYLPFRLIFLMGFSVLVLGGRI